ncbi:MAG: putative lipoprotein [Gallionellaceae bacterium]|nr:MAG: putative lipoprotein [Gallionellaceae bacterium]
MISNYSTKLVAFSVALLCACASPTVVQSVKPGDSGLTCAALQNEYADAENFKKTAGSEKGVTGGNVARLLFWPAIIGTYMNANEAIAAADNRKVHLANLMAQKNCAIPEASQAAGGNTTDSVQNAATTRPTKEAKLAELKALYDANLISKEAYTERQKVILDAP